MKLSRWRDSIDKTTYSFALEPAKSRYLLKDKLLPHFNKTATGTEDLNRKINGTF